MSSDEIEFELTPSKVIWAIMAVTSLWLLGWLIVAVGFSLSWCLGAGCDTAAPDWVFVTGVIVGLGVMLAAGPVAMRMTKVKWTLIASFGGPIVMMLMVFGLRFAS